MRCPGSLQKESADSSPSGAYGFTYYMMTLSLCVVFLMVHQARFLCSGSIEEMMAYSSGRVSRSLRTSHTGMESVRHSKITRVLRQFAERSVELAPSVGHRCHAKESRKVFIRGRQYGQFSNILISLAHGLGFVDVLNTYYREQEQDIHYALVVPNYMARELHSFDLRVLRGHYCFVMNEVPSVEEQADQEASFSISTLFSMKKTMALKVTALVEMLWKRFDYPAISLRRDLSLLATQQGRYRPALSPPSAYTYAAGKNDIKLDSKDLFFWGRRHSVARRFRSFPYLRHGLPDEQAALREREYYTRTYVAVLCALWSSVNPSVVSGAVVLLREMELEGGGDPRRPDWEVLLEYSSVHQRGLDGECEAIMRSNADWARDFSYILGNDTSCSPQDGDWCQRDHLQTLLCDMPSGFVKRVCAGERKIYLASDSLPPYPRTSLRKFSEKPQIVMGWDLRRRLGLAESLSTHEISCIDLLLCVLGTGLFIGNPRSTFSFQITTLRAVLGQRSVPRVRNHDLYFVLGEEDLWISQSSVENVTSI